MRHVWLGLALSLLSVNLARAQPAQAGSASSAGNPAIALSGAKKDTPARGANSFTQGQASDRITSRGFSGVKDLAKDKEGVWRGNAEKDGKQVAVWLDYTGAVGQTAATGE